MNSGSSLSHKKIHWPVLFLFLTAALLRFSFLELKPPHHDEGVNGSFVGRLAAEGFYRYDPTNYHGPLHFYLVFLCQQLLGKTLFALRFPTVVFSILTVGLALSFKRFFGSRACWIAAWAIVLSPAMVFYGRYSIHETELVFFTLLVLWGILGLFQEGRKSYVWAVGLGIAGMIVSKETHIIHVACFLAALLIVRHSEPRRGEESRSRSFAPSALRMTRIRRRDLWEAAAVSAFLVLFFYSGGFLYPKGVTGLYETYSAWFKTGTAQAGHRKPWIYWTYILCRYELPALLGLFFTVVYGIYSQVRRIRYTAFYALGIFMAYSLVPYKTPWCAINFIVPLCLVFGIFCDEFLMLDKSRRLAIVFIGALFAFSLTKSVLLNFVHYEDEKEAYVYTHTFNDVKKLTRPLDALVKKDPLQYEIKGAVILRSAWPLPWMLSDFPNIGYYSDPQKADDPDAGFLIISADKTKIAEERLRNAYFTQDFRLNSVQPTGKLYFSYEIFKDIFPGRKPEFVPRPREPLKPGEGLFAFFYDNKDWQGEPVLKKTVEQIDFYWEDQDRVMPPPFSMELKGEILLPGDVKIALESDDGGFVDVGGRRIIDDPGPHSRQSREGFVTAKAGWAPIRVGVYDVGGGTVAKLKWFDQKGEQGIVPASAFRSNEKSLKQGAGG